MIPWLQGDAPFPDVETALADPNGLLAAGDDLSAERLLAAYRRGIFPWFSAGQPVLWWSPDPRMVLFPSELKVSRSLAKVLRNSTYEIRFDTAFQDVMRACAAPRAPEVGGRAQIATSGRATPPQLPGPGLFRSLQISSWYHQPPRQRKDCGRPRHEPAARR